MQFQTEDEIHVPQDFAFSQFTNFIRYEPTAAAYGAVLRRVDGFTEVAEGVTWRGTIPIRGTTRPVEATVTEYQPVSAAQMKTVVGGMEVVVDFEFEALAEERTRVKAIANLKASTLAARLIIQSIKLARKQLQKRIDAKLISLGSEFEGEYRRLNA